MQMSCGCAFLTGRFEIARTFSRVRANGRLGDLGAGWQRLACRWVGADERARRRVIGQIGTDGATGYVIEYAGEAVRGLSMEGRMTLCNMSIEAGARAAMVAPDETTFAYMQGKRFAPHGDQWDKAVAYWRTLSSDQP